MSFLCCLEVPDQLHNNNTEFPGVVGWAGVGGPSHYVVTPTQVELSWVELGCDNEQYILLFDLCSINNWYMSYFISIQSIKNHELRYRSGVQGLLNYFLSNISHIMNFLEGWGCSVISWVDGCLEAKTKLTLQLWGKIWQYWISFSLQF